MRAILALAILIGTAAAAAADTGPLIVIPGRAGVPVMINGRDASYAIVEGEWGLAKHFKNADRVYGGWDRYIGPEHARLVFSVGALFDFMAGEFARAPERARNLRIEWLHRFRLEPRRLWRRYFVGGPVFAARVVAFAASERWSALARALRQPGRELPEN